MGRASSEKEKTPVVMAGLRHRVSTVLRAAASILALIFFAGCAPPAFRHAEVVPVPAPPLARTDCRWWHARVRIHWPEGAEPAWYLDALLHHLNAVFGCVPMPVFERLWRQF